MTPSSTNSGLPAICVATTGNAAGHRFHQHHRHAFGKTGHHEYIGLRQQGPYLRLRLIPDKSHLPGDAKGRGLLFQCGAVRAIAGNRQNQVRMFALELSDGFE